MSVIGVISMKGGVGKTSTTANVAYAMAAQLGRDRISVIDLDPQNGLHWHFGVDSENTDGVCEHSLKGLDWANASLPSEFGVNCIPYGRVEESEREAFEILLANDSNWVGEQIQRAGLDRDGLVLIDTPPGPSIYLKQVFACADLVLIVLLADAGSYATIPAMEAWLAEMSITYPNTRSVYVINQVDRNESLNRDVAELLQQHLGKRLAPTRIHRDEAVGEALAMQQPVLVYDPHGQASHDLVQLATWVINRLNR
jgi:cellulose synthase operon protein YhjQ